VVASLICGRQLAAAAAQDQPSPRQVLARAMAKWADLVEPREGAAPQTLTAQIKLVNSEGLPKEVMGLVADLAFQAPDELRVTGTAQGFTLSLGRDGNTIWIHEPQKNFAVLGKTGVAPFKAEPKHLDDTHLPPFRLPLSRLKLAMIPMMLNVEQQPEEKINGDACDVLKAALPETVSELLGIDAGVATLYIRQSDQLPLRLAYADGQGRRVQVDVIDPKVSQPAPAESWNLRPNAGDHVETVALSHLLKFLNVAPKILTEKVAPLGAADGSREVLATEGQGRLEMIDGTRVLFLKGSPQEMGRQQGKLLNKEVHRICDRILYGVGVGSSFEKGKWFFSEIEGAVARLEPFMDQRYLAEMDAMADAAGMDHQEARLSNFFPELFHCSGFSLFGKATRDGHMYHGRVLDYLRGVGLEQNAVVMVYQPDYGNAWVNLGYAGFIGSVTAMNEKGISIGEMGGRGYGNWDGKPMAELLREVMEKASTLEEAVRIMRLGPRTCEYYYVISDGNTKQAVGIAATPDRFDVIHPGEAVPQLPHPFDDTVLLSAGDRYETLSRRVKDGYGNFDALSARELMSRPVCMTSNIQSVLFRPDTLDFWVANADSKHVASATRFTHYNLRDLLTSAPPKPRYKFDF
jgi:hypothetical protein